MHGLASEGFETAFELRRSHRMEDESGLIASAAAELGAQLIVVGTRGQGRVAGALFGSVAQGLLHRAPCPVLVVPPAPEEMTRKVQPGCEPASAAVFLRNQAGYRGLPDRVLA